MHLNIDCSHLQLRRHGALRSWYAVAACLAIVSLGFTGTSQTASASPAITVVSQDNGKTVQLEIGQQIVVRLPSNPTTGYQWSVIGSMTPLEFSKSDYATDSQAAGRAGAGGTETLRFTAKSAGKAELKLGYARAWEKDVPPAKTFSLTVLVK
jgi:inhibitor of cysteine peptidase